MTFQISYSLNISCPGIHPIGYGTDLWLIWSVKIQEIISDLECFPHYMACRGLNPSCAAAVHGIGGPASTTPFSSHPVAQRELGVCASRVWLTQQLRMA